MKFYRLSYIYIYIYKYICIICPTGVEGDVKAPFSIVYTDVWVRVLLFSLDDPLTLDPYLIVLSAIQGSIKYHFLSCWYDMIWD